MANDEEDKLGERETHESYGMVGFHRTHGGQANLFGSAIREHGTTISLTLRPGFVRHHLGRDWYYADPKSIVRIRMSAAQFAELISNPDVGDGVPCTIERLDGKAVPPPPERPLESEKVKLGFEAKWKDLFKTVSDAIGKVHGLAEKAITKRDRAALVEDLKNIERMLNDHLPYAMDSFTEAADKVVKHAKQEVDAFVAHAYHAVGKETIERMRLAADTRQLPEVKGVPELPPKED